jgi:2,3-dihydroxy-p-cumate/2,3-dihydroxybenzoate 3,4-dioxygenase
LVSLQNDDVISFATAIRVHDMIDLKDIRTVRLNTRDLEGARRYATQVLGLQEVSGRVSKTGGSLYFASDSRDHTLVYCEGDPLQHATAFEVADMAALNAAGTALEAAGRPVRHASAEECELRRCKAALFFTDPTGNALELVVQPFHSGKRYFPSRDAGITGFSHVGLRSTDPKRDEAFWTQVLGARVSDRIGEAPLLRIDPVHHRIALFPSAYAGVQHINHQVESIDDLMRAYYLLREKGIRIVFGPGRHPTSSAMFLYFEGPDGMVFEYSTGVRLIEDEATYRPRQFPFSPESFCMWGSKPDIPEFRSA